MPLLADHDLEALRPPGNPDDLVCVGYRPVFKEHTNRAGQKIGQRELTRINARCNERVMDTGDFSPLAVGHTRDDGSKDPEVIGFVGPYRMGKVGNLNPKHAIEGKVWVFRHQLETLKKYPRLSVEFWADEQDPGNGYFDPISLLGAETPELDLGVHYAKNRDGVRLMKYSKVERFQAAAPGGGNTFVPGMVGGERDEDRDESGEIKHQYDKESSDMVALNAADIQQIVAALTPVCKQIMSEMQSSNKGETQPGGDDLGDDLDLDNDPDLDVGDDLDGMDEGDADGLGDEDADGIPDDEDSDDDDDGIPDIDDEDSDLGLGDDSDLEDADEPPGGDVADSDDDDSDDDDTEPFDKSDEDKEPKMADKPDEKKKPVKFSKEPIPGMTVEKYAKENAELRERYEKSIAETRATKEELATLKTRIDAIETEKKKAVRYSKLNDLRGQGFVVDVAEELADTEPLNDEQFAKHCTKIVEKYARAPVGAGLYIPPSEKHDGNSPDVKRERYARAAGDVAKELQKAGKPVDYAAIRDNVERNDGKYVPAA